jgi:rare lipoprotein A
MAGGERAESGFQPPNRVRSLALTLCLTLLAGCAGLDSSTTSEGQASWYGAQHQGKTTASGEPFDMNALTAAHRELPFGTRVRVTNLDNGRSVIVRINDRGPFRKGRIIDLSRKAAQQLDMLKNGIAPVRIEIVDS